jgi:hypothetical protein
LKRKTSSSARRKNRPWWSFFLLTDLWLEKGKSFGDLFQLSGPWTELDWFRDGDGREYLGQVGIETGDDVALEQLFRRLSYNGFLEYSAEPRTLNLRRPAERLINMARRLHRQIQAAGDDALKEEAPSHE